MTGVAKNTVVKLLADIGNACADYQDKALRNLPCQRLQLDEIWSFVYSKQKNVPADKQGQFGYGDIWTWTAIDADTKLVPSWYVGWRNAECADLFIRDLAGRLANRVQLTTDGLKVYINAIDKAFGNAVDFAQLVKIYGPDRSTEARYSPPVCIGALASDITGKPEVEHFSTSYVERQNLTMRMQMRRFTRLTNGFSKKVENHAAAIALHFMHYNYCRIHQTLRITPAMAAGVSDHVWELGEVIDLLLLN